MRAFIYCRVSTREQSTEDHYSLDNQEQHGRDYLTLKRWQLVKTRKDVASGKNDEREGFQELLADMLRNPVYCGRVRVNGSVAEGLHEAIVSPEQFDQAQQLIQSRPPLPPRSHHSKHLLSGIARCGICGTSLKTHYIVSNPKGSKKSYDYRLYGHSANAKVGEKSCRGFAKSGERLEAVIVEQIRQASTLA